MMLLLMLLLLMRFCIIEGCNLKDTSLGICFQKTGGIFSKLQNLFQKSRNHEVDLTGINIMYSSPSHLPYLYLFPSVYYAHANSVSNSDFHYIPHPPDRYYIVPSYFEMNAAYSTPSAVPDPVARDQPGSHYNLTQHYSNTPTSTMPETLTFAVKNSEHGQQPTATSVYYSQKLLISFNEPVSSIPFHGNSQNAGVVLQSSVSMSPSETTYLTSSSAAEFNPTARPIHESMNPCLIANCRAGHICTLKRSENCQNTRCLVPVCVDPCENVKCAENQICRVEKKSCHSSNCEPVARCQNPCENVQCAENQICRVEKKSCDFSYCEPRAKCQNPCDEVQCPQKMNCSVVRLPCDQQSCPLVPVCGGNPCINKICPQGEGCYLKSTCRDSFCRITPYCQNPCQNTTCPDDEFCYSQNVECLKTPCNPIAVCRNPCDSIRCQNNEKCILQAAFCFRGTCPPIPICKPF